MAVFWQGWMRYLLGGLWNPEKGIQRPGPTGYANAAKVAISDDRALQIAAVFRCIRIIAETCATLPLITYKKTATGREPTKDHWLAKLLAAPNETQTGDEWRESVIAQIAGWGNAYGQIVRTSMGKPQELWNYKTDRMKVERRENRTLQYTYPDIMGVPKELKTQDVLHMRGFSVDGVMGVSPLGVARETLGLAVGAENYAASFFASGGRPSGILSTDRLLQPEQREKLAQQFGGLAEGGTEKRLWVLEAALKYEPISVSPEDMQMLQTRAFQIADIARFFGVPLFLLMETEKSTSWGCLPGETPIFTETGHKRIDEVRAGDLVWSFDGEKKVKSKVVRQWMTGVKPLIEINTIGRSLRLTANHVVFVRRYFGRADGADLGQCGWKDEWIRADQVKTGDYLAVPHALEREYDNGDLSEGLMEFCGLYTGDGSLDKNRVEIAHEKSPDYIDHYKTIIQAEFGERAYSDSRRTRFSSLNAVRFLIARGFTGTSDTKRVPPWVFGLSDELICAYLRGYVDSDGSIADGGIHFSSCHFDLLQDIRYLCMQIGVPVGRIKLGRMAGASVIRGRTIVQNEKYVLSLNSVNHNHRIGSNSAKKAQNLRVKTQRTQAYDDSWNGLASRGEKFLKYGPAHEWNKRGLKLQPVRSISAVKGPDVPVYDLAVEQTHSYCADGVLVHNSGIEQQNLAFLTYTLMPYLSRLENSINRFLIPENERGEVFVEHDASPLLKADSTARANFYAQMAQNGLMTRNEIRARENLMPKEGGDMLTAQINLAPLDKLGAKQEPVVQLSADDMAKAIIPHIQGRMDSLDRNLAEVKAKTSQPQPVSNGPVVNVEPQPVNVTVKMELPEQKAMKKTVKRNDDGVYEVLEVPEDANPDGTSSESTGGGDEIAPRRRQAGRSR